MSDNDDDPRNEDGQPKRKKRAPMFYKEYLQKGQENTAVPRTTLIDARVAISRPLLAPTQGSSAPGCSGSCGPDPAAILTEDDRSRDNPTARSILGETVGSSEDEGGELASEHHEHQLSTEEHSSTEGNSRDSSQLTPDDSSLINEEDVRESDSDHSSNSSSSKDSAESGEFGSTYTDRAKKLKEKYSLEDKLTMVDCERLTKIECLVLRISFARRHGLTDTALEDLAVLINFILGHKCIPEPVGIINEIFRYDFGEAVHYYCHMCEGYIGKESDLIAQNRRQDPKNDVIVKCPVNLCGTDCNVSKKNGGHFFIHVPLPPQFRCFLESKPNATELLSYRWTRNQSEDTICDVFDGELYKELSKDGGILSDPANISITVNTDGVPIFKSRNNSLWPILCQINELPPDLRFSSDNTFVCGLWFGSKHPNMSVYLNQFVLESRPLHNDGFEWTNEQGDAVCSKVVTLNSSLDSVAKVDVQCRKSFLGYDGCGYCYHPGHLVDLTNDVLIPLPGAGNDEARVRTNAVQRNRDDDSLSDDSDRHAEVSNVRIVKQVRYCFSRGGGVILIELTRTFVLIWKKV